MARLMYAPVQIERIDACNANAIIALKNRVRSERSRDEPGVFFAPVNCDLPAHRSSDDRFVDGPRSTTALRDAAQDAHTPFRDSHDETRNERRERNARERRDDETRRRDEMTRQRRRDESTKLTTGTACNVDVGRVKDTAMMKMEKEKVGSEGHFS